MCPVFFLHRSARCTVTSATGRLCWLALLALVPAMMTAADPPLAERMEKVAVITGGHLHVVRMAQPFVMAYANDSAAEPQVTKSPFAEHGQAGYRGFDVDDRAVLLVGKPKRVPPDDRPIIYMIDREVGFRAKVVEQTINNRLLRTLDTSSAYAARGIGIVDVLGLPFGERWDQVDLFSNADGQMAVAVATGHTVKVFVNSALQAGGKAAKDQARRGVFDREISSATASPAGDPPGAIGDLVFAGADIGTYVLSGGRITMPGTPGEGVPLPAGGVQVIIDKDAGCCWYLGSAAVDLPKFRWADARLIERLAQLEKKAQDAIGKIQAQLGYAGRKGGDQ